MPHWPRSLWACELGEHSSWQRRRMWGFLTYLERWEAGNCCCPHPCWSDTHSSSSFSWVGLPFDLLRIVSSDVGCQHQDPGCPQRSHLLWLGKHIWVKIRPLMGPRLRPGQQFWQGYCLEIGWQWHWILYCCTRVSQNFWVHPLKIIRKMGYSTRDS